MPALTLPIRRSDLHRIRTLVAALLIAGVSLASDCPAPPEPDSDGDGLIDALEVACGTTPVSSFDQDGDGLSDGAEVLILDTDPCAAESHAFVVDLDPSDPGTMAVAGTAIAQPGDPATSVDGAIEWKDIPYANAPVGDLRLEPPDEQVVPWANLPNAGGANFACWQARSGLETTFDTWTLSEDCLRLDVVTPLSVGPPPFDETADLAPVMVWIHGGGFVTGSKNSNDWSSFAGETGAVVVSINYRLGALGFHNWRSLAPGPELPEANLGLRDQIAALRWVRDNISAFGGDPERVTIFGTSAGGTSVMALVASEETDGLFHRAIAQSPGVADQLPGFDAPSGLFIAESVRGQHVSQALGCDGSVDELECLRTKDAAEFVSADVLASDSWPLLPNVPQHLPSIDGEILTEQPATALAAHRKVPIIIGTAGNEADTFMMAGDHPLLANEDEFAIELEDIPGVTSDGLADLLDAYAPSSFDDGTSSVPGFDAGATRARNRLYSDILFHCPALAAATEAEGSAPAYVYRFDHTVRQQVTYVPAENDADCGLPAPDPADCHVFYPLLHPCEVPTEGTQWLCEGADVQVADPESESGYGSETHYGWVCGTPVYESWAFHSSETSFLTGSFGFGGACTPNEQQTHMTNALRVAWGEFAATDTPEAFAPVGLIWPRYSPAPFEDKGSHLVDWLTGSASEETAGVFVPRESLEYATAPSGEERCAVLDATLF